MKKELTIEQKNITIARFEGRKFYGRHTIDEYGGETCNSLPEMKYHFSWDWLMPVVERIQSIEITPPPNYRGYRIEIVPSGYVSIKGFSMPPISTNVSIEGSLINAVYKAAYNFIEWYNQQTPPGSVTGE